MPKGYVIGHITVNNPEKYQEYIIRDTPIIEKHGGIPIVRGGQSESLEGPDFARHVIFAFPDYESAKALYHSPEYQEVIKIRHATAESMIVLVEGT